MATLGWIASTHLDLAHALHHSMHREGARIFLDRERFLSHASDDLIWFLSSPYVSGQGIESLIHCITTSYRKHGLCATADLLGESLILPHAEPTVDLLNEITQKQKESFQDLEEQADENVSTFLELLTRIHQKTLEGALPHDPQRRTTISLKPSSFCVTTPDGPTASSFSDSRKRIETIVGYARDTGYNVTIDMEDTRWTQFTINTYIDLVKNGYTNLGIAVQTKLNRTASDIERIIDEIGPAARVRLVIGVYEERGNPDALPSDKKDEMKERMLIYARKLLAAGSYPEFASHDEHYTLRFMEEVIRDGGYQPHQFEIQHLKGVPRKALQRRIIRGDIFTKKNADVESILFAYTAGGTEFSGGHPTLLPLLPASLGFPIGHPSHLTPYNEPTSSKPTGGCVVRLYTPFAASGLHGKASAVSYCRRRLKENEDMWRNALIYGPRLYLQALGLALSNKRG